MPMIISPEDICNGVANPYSVDDGITKTLNDVKIIDACLEYLNKQRKDNGDIVSLTSNFLNYLVRINISDELFVYALTQMAFKYRIPLDKNDPAISNLFDKYQNSLVKFV